MKKAVLAMVLFGVMVGLGGCFISVNGDCSSKKQAQKLQIDPTIAEIDAAKTLASDSARLNVLRAIAQRPGLSPEARVHLVEAIPVLESQSAREEVLMGLAENPPMPQEPKPCGQTED